MVLFALTKELKRSPEVIGNELGEALKASNPHLFPAFNVIKGFLNISLGDNYWLEFLEEHHDNPFFGFAEQNGQRIMVEYSSPNTNKPLHLGHLRNNFLGWSVAEIYKANGFDVIKTCIVNDIRNSVMEKRQKPVAKKAITSLVTIMSNLKMS